MKKNQCPYQYAFNFVGELVTVYCGRWDCSHCAKHNANRWAIRVRIHLELSNHEAYFWTVTMRGKYKERDKAYEALPRLWDTFRKTIQRSLGKSWEYCAFVEGQPHRRGMPHFHIISMAKCPVRLKDLAMECGFGYEDEESVVTSIRAALYVSKYASKGDKKMPKSFRRVRACHTWSKLPPARRQPLIVQAKDEQIQHYLVRVSDITGKDLDVLYTIWQARAPGL